MKSSFRILGSGSGMPDPVKTQSCIWLEKEKLLLDCGEGCAAKLVKFNLLNKVDAIAISHFHPDHVTGLYSLLQAFHLTKRIKSLTIYLPESILEFQSSLKIFYLDSVKFMFKCEFLEMEKISDNFDVVSIPTDHMQKYINSKNGKKSYAFSFPKTGFVYSSDVNNLDFLKQVDNISVLVLDGLHPIADEIIKLGKDSKLGKDLSKNLGKNLGKSLEREISSSMNSETRIIITHGLSEKLKKIITSRFELANENKEYYF